MDSLSHTHTHTHTPECMPVHAGTHTPTHPDTYTPTHMRFQNGRRAVGGGQKRFGRKRGEEVQAWGGLRTQRCTDPDIWPCPSIISAIREAEGTTAFYVCAGDDQDCPSADDTG